MSDLKSFLPLFLHGPGFSPYKHPGDEEKEEYGKMKTTLSSELGMNCYMAHEQLHSRLLQDGATVDAHLADLRQLATLTRVCRAIG